jgi:threonine dehydratase
MKEAFPTADDICTAHERIRPYVHRTAVLTSRTLNRLTENDLFFKCENFQKVGAFKYRGATNAVLQLSETEAARGVATHSSGNHAQALALAAKMRGIPAFIVMPETAPKVKVAAVKDYGAKIIFCKPTLQAREDTLNKVVAETGARFIHPYNDWQVITGQATCAKELLEDVNHLDAVLAPVGGGGLLSGTALSAHYFSPQTRVIACEPEGADDAYRSFRAGKIIPSVTPNTLADGLLTSLGERTFAVIRQHVSEIVTVPEAAIISAMRLIWERMKIIVEPSAAVPLGALLSGKLRMQQQRIGIILSGGNVDLERLPWLTHSTQRENK